MATALNIITRAMQKAGILFKQETPDADEAMDALSELNDMLAQWSNDSMLIVERVRESFPSTGVASYTMGSGGDFDTARPISIVSMFARIGSTDYPIAPITDDNYSLIQTKSTLGVPDFFNYTNGYPLGTINLYPVSSVAYEIHIYSDKQIGDIASLTTNINFPPGWKSAIIYNLGVRLCSEFGQPVSGELFEMAKQSKAAIRRSIIKSRSKDAFPQQISNRNVYTGWNS